MTDGWTALETLEHNLGWHWPLSFNRVEELPDGTVAGIFSRTYQGKKTIFYELTIIFHSHRYGEGEDFVQYRFGKMSFDKRQLPTTYKKEIREQFKTILKNYNYLEERENPYAS